uniref:MTAP family purine nucleoside phosphorylase n=1 Tax=uncultured Cobetia sp. TaxID=410706 RepID=UPI002594DB4B
MLAVIGGTGFGSWAGMEVLRRGGQETPLGAASCGVVEGRLNGQSLLFLARHGQPHKVPPHRINYRANLWALKQAGATHVVGVNCVSGIDPTLAPGTLVVPDQLIDYTTGREGSFFDGRFKPFQHVSFAWPYHRGWREELHA